MENPYGMWALCQHDVDKLVHLLCPCDFMVYHLAVGYREYLFCVTPALCVYVYVCVCGLRERKNKGGMTSVRYQQ